jgi:hypothetical protein
MNATESIAVFEDMKSVFPQAVVTVAVQVDANTTVTTTGLRNNKMITRAMSRGGLSNNQDFSILCLTSPFAGQETEMLAIEKRISEMCGKATMTLGTEQYRIMAARVFALGGLVAFSTAEYDRVVQ